VVSRRQKHARACVRAAMKHFPCEPKASIMADQKRGRVEHTRRLACGGAALRRICIAGHETHTGTPPLQQRTRAPQDPTAPAALVTITSCGSR
jgi:hypothetical protein